MTTDELPVTAEWLRAVGFEEGYYGGTPVAFVPQVGCEDFRLLVPGASSGLLTVAGPCREEGESGFAFWYTSHGLPSAPLPTPATRGQVLALCRGLGVTIKESS